MQWVAATQKNFNSYDVSFIICNKTWMSWHFNSFLNTDCCCHTRATIATTQTTDTLILETGTSFLVANDLGGSCVSEKRHLQDRWYLVAK